MTTRTNRDAGTIIRLLTARSSEALNAWLAAANDAGWTATDLARLAGVSRQAITARITTARGRGAEADAMDGLLEEYPIPPVPERAPSPNKRTLTAPAIDYAGADEKAEKAVRRIIGDSDAPPVAHLDALAQLAQSATTKKAAAKGRRDLAALSLAVYGEHTGVWVIAGIKSLQGWANLLRSALKVPDGTAMGDISGSRRIELAQEAGLPDLGEKAYDELIAARDEYTRWAAVERTAMRWRDRAGVALWNAGELRDAVASRMGITGGRLAQIAAKHEDEEAAR